MAAPCCLIAPFVYIVAALLLSLRLNLTVGKFLIALSTMPPQIPDRWTAYKPCGKVIEKTQLICFKVPLRRSIQTGKADEIWDIPALLERVPNLGAVIDLTNTARYYNPQDLISAGVLHRKILVPGRILPPQDKVTEFMDCVDEFLGRVGAKLVGVHCTHGLNRTGYMVCRYMRDRMNVPASLAIKRFEKARGYQIERDNYIADLLGLEPKPAQFGSHTSVKALDEEDEDAKANREDDEATRDWSARYRRSHNNDLSWRRRDSDADYEDSFSSFHRRSRDDRCRRSRYNNPSRQKSESESSSSYDYRHDY